MHIFRRLTAKNSILSSLAKYRRVPLVSLFHSSPDASIEVISEEQEVVIALGSNVGDRLGNFNQALQLMKKLGIDIKRHGGLYETEPAYVTDQPLFLNSAVRASTKLGPHELLATLKKTERDIGRTDGIRYGPRPIDLDILFYGKYRVSSEKLTVPHERIWERPFVMAPVIDLMGSDVENDTVASWHSASKLTGGLFEAWEKLGGKSLIGKHGMRRVLPVGNRLWDWSQRTSVMGTLNVTPDSFSDGGKYLSVENAVSQVRRMISEGADIIDLGAQSTRPMATRISVEEELDRLMPVLEAIRGLAEAEGKLISVDTFYATVASEAVSQGAHLVNDVSGGHLDSKMYDVLSSLKLPYIAMHMRGDPTTMQNSDNLKYDDVCKEVGSELSLLCRDAELSGIPSWNMIIDPGIGFSKNTEQNIDILMGLSTIREEIAKNSIAVSHGPMLIGPSRKRFLGEICGCASADERDYATIAAVSAGVLGGANIVRVHNVKAAVDAVKLCDAMLRRRSIE